MRFARVWLVGWMVLAGIVAGACGDGGRSCSSTCKRLTELCDDEAVDECVLRCDAVREQDREEFEQVAACLDGVANCTNARQCGL